MKTKYLNEILWFDLAWKLQKDAGVALCRDLSYDRVLPSYWPRYPRQSCYEEKTLQPTRHRIYADSSQPTPDASLCNADCRLASTADSTFQSALIGGIRPTVSPNLRTHLPTAVGRQSLRRLVGRCVLKIGRCVPSIINIRRLTLRSQFRFVKTFIGGQDATIVITYTD